MTPSSLTFSTGPNRLAAIAAVVRAPSMTPPCSTSVRLADDAGSRRPPAAARSGRRPSRRRARPARRARSVSRSVADGPRAGAGGRGGMARRGTPASAAHGHVEPIGGRHELRDAASGSRHHDEQRAFARVGQIERRLEEAHRERVVADGLGPQPVLRLQIEQVPGARRGTRRPRAPFGEHLDLARRAEHGTDVPVLQASRARAAGRLRARHHERRLLAQPCAPHRSTSMMSSSRPSALARNTVRTPSASR